MKRKCRICGNEMRESTLTLHAHELGPMGDQCMGCWTAQTQLELFLIRATITPENEGGRTIMGPWAEGWLKEILKDPRRYL